MDEIWKDIKGYEGLYQISNLGKIKSLNFNKTGESKELRQTIDYEGYAYVRLSKKGKSKPFKVHRLVAQTFIPNPDNKPQVNHKKEFEKDNNCVDNLEWATCKENINYGTCKIRSAEKRTPKLSKKVNKYSLAGQFIRQYNSAREAGRISNMDSSSISKCCRGERKCYKGFKWEYA